MRSIMVMLVVLEGFEEVVVFGEGLVGASPGHVVGSVLKLFSPESDGLLSLISDIGIHKRFEFLSGSYLAFFLESVGHSQVLIHVFDINWSSVLIIHDQFSHYVFSQWFGDKCFAIGRSEDASAGLLLTLFLFFAELLGDLL